MLNSAHIQNFRLFKDFQIDDLARVNLIVGKNNVGKSSLLEALYLLVNPNSPNALVSLLENRGEMAFYDKPSDTLNFSTTIGKYDISHLFYSHKLEDGATIILKAGGDSLPYKISYTENWQEFVDPMDYEAFSASLPLLLLDNSNGNNKNEVKIHLDQESMVSQNAFTKSLRSGKPLHKTESHYVTTKGFNYRLLAKLWNNIALTPKEDEITKMLQIIDSDIARIGFITHQTENTGIIIKHQKQESPIPLGNMGDGIHRVLTIAMTLANAENGFLLIDEIDTGLHYRAITDMWQVVMETAVRLNIQVFATTHSWDCVESFTEALEMQENSDVGALFRLERRENDQIAAVKYTADDLAIATKQSIEVR